MNIEAYMEFYKQKKGEMDEKRERSLCQIMPSRWRPNLRPNHDQIKKKHEKHCSDEH